MVKIPVVSKLKLGHHPFWLASITEAAPSTEWSQKVDFEQEIGKCESQMSIVEGLSIVDTFPTSPGQLEFRW